MAERNDLVLEILQAIQARLGNVERELAEIRRVQAQHTGKFEELEIYTAYETGLGTQNKADLQAIRKTIKAMEERLRRLETPA
jgi:hypothetical protein